MFCLTGSITPQHILNILQLFVAFYFLRFVCYCCCLSLFVCLFLNNIPLGIFFIADHTLSCVICKNEQVCQNVHKILLQWPLSTCSGIEVSSNYY